jgi:hypothetical protein
MARPPRRRNGARSRAAGAEYLAAFRSDVETFLSREAVDACVSSGVFERPPIQGVSYSAFVDPSGGSSGRLPFRIAPKQECPLWVISGRLARHSGMSAFCRLADMLGVGIDVC